MRMGLFKRFVSQTRKPDGFLGEMMLSSMNSGHAKMADWGFSRLPSISPENAVDLGCGAGRNVGELLKRYPGAHMTGIDYSDLSVEKAKDYNKRMIEDGRCEVVQGDVSDLKLPAEAFDLATAFETIYFWPGLEKCFAKVAGVLKPGGYLLSLILGPDTAPGASIGTMFLSFATPSCSADCWLRCRTQRSLRHLKALYGGQRRNEMNYH